jgi:uncharacterized protein (DUF924 family)
MSVEAVLSFWFGSLGPDAVPEPRFVERWFGGGPAFDEECREAFGSHVAAALRGERDAWAATPPGRLALVLLLDQLTRNIHRGTARSFAGDERALAQSAEAVRLGEDRSLRPIERYFLYMPFEHAEDLAMQRRAVELFEGLLRAAPARALGLFEQGVEYARRHAAVIARFGRFPGRNAALGRASTPQEEAFLLAHPTGF